MTHFNKFMEKKLIFSYEITNGCNLRCPYCYQLDELNNSKKYNTEVAKEIIKQIQLFKINYPDYILELDLLGGDPLYCPNLFEFLEELLSTTSIDVWVVTNLTPKDDNIIYVLGKFLQKYPKLGVSATYHDSCDHDKWKKNMKHLQQFKVMKYSQADEVYYPNIVSSLVLMNDDSMYEKYTYMKDNDIQYGITHYYSHSVDKHKRHFVFSEYNKETQEIYKNSINYKSIYYTINDRKITTEEFEEKELYHISMQQPVICNLLNFAIDFDGNITNSCSYESVKFNITDGIHPKNCVCANSYCHCSVNAYKKVPGEL